MRLSVLYTLLVYYRIYFLPLCNLQKTDSATKVTPSIDCSNACNILSNPVPISLGQVAAKISLPLLFQLTFKVQVAGNDHGYLANLVNIYSDSLQVTFLSISVEPYVNQIDLIYNGEKLFSYGPPITFSPDQYSTVTVTVQEHTLTFTTDSYGRAYPITKPAPSPKNTVYLSGSLKDADHDSATGFIQAFSIMGNFKLLISLTYHIFSCHKSSHSTSNNHSHRSTNRSYTNSFSYSHTGSNS